MVTFSYNGISVILPSPKFNNTDEFKITRIQRTTPGQELIIFRDPTWTFGESFNLSFEYVDSTAINAMQAFVQTTLGLPVTFIDHENNVWPVIIVSPDFETKTPGRANNSFDLKLEVIFE